MARNKDRGTPEVSSGSMADIAFLLLIFFLVTTTIANDKGILMQLPPPPEEEIEIKLQERNIFKILANSKDQLLVEDEPWTRSMEDLKVSVKEHVLNFGSPDQGDVDVFNSLPPKLKNMVRRDPDGSDGPGDAIVSFKANRGTSYELYIDVLDAVHGAYNEIYGERIGITADEYLQLDRSDDTQKRMYDQGKEGIPKAISIAEPDK